MQTTPLLLRMTALERRVRRIEEKLLMEPSSHAEPRPEPTVHDTTEAPKLAPPPVPPAVADVQAKENEQLVELTIDETPTSAPPPIPLVERPLTAPPRPAPRRPALSPLSSAPVINYAPAPKPAPVPRGEIEQAIGLKWAGWIGAIVLVIGAGLGIKYAVDNGWLGVLPPALRLGLMYLGGFALIGAGEWVYRRVNDIASAGVFAAGVATLFLVSYAGHGMYGLYARDTAFVLMGISTLVGAAVAIRGKLVSVATLSLIGGNIAPIVLRGDHAHLTGFLAYLLMLQIVALVLAWWGGSRKWWMLRALSLGTTGLWMTWIIAQPTAPALLAPQIFLLIFAVLFHVEVIVSTARRIKEPLTISDAGAQPGVVFSTLVTAALTGGMYLLLRDEPNHVRGIWTLIFAAATFATAFALPRKKFPSLKALAIGYGLQSAMLLIAAVPMLFSGSGIIFGWSILACGFAALGAILDLNIARRTAVVVWGLGCVYLLKWAPTPVGQETWLTLFATAIPAYLVVAGTLTLAGNIVAILFSMGRREAIASLATEPLQHFVSVAACVVWIIAALTALPTLGATLAFLAYAWLLFGGDLLRPRSGLVHQSAIVLLLATLKWVVIDNLADRIAPGWSAAKYTPVFNPVMGLGMLIAASLSAIVWIRRAAFMALVHHDSAEGKDASRLMLLTAGFVLVFMTIGFSFEVDRIVEKLSAGTVLAWPPDQAKHLAWTILWVASSCGLVGLARLFEPDESRRRDAMRRFAVLLIALSIKFMIIDLFSYRVAGPPADVLIFANLQTLAAMFILGGLALAWFVDGPHEPDSSSPRLRFIGTLVIALLLLVGTFEIDRWAAYQTFSHPWFVRQVGFSIFWSAFGVACVAVGFRTRVAALRYCGLTLLAITLVKVVTVDLGQISTGYRVLSFMGLGMLLLGTSVLYGKLSPRLLALASNDEAAS